MQIAVADKLIVGAEKVALVVFDWDGTVMDSIGRIVSSLRSAASLSELVVPTEHEAKQIIGLAWDHRRYQLQRHFGNTAKGHI